MNKKTEHIDAERAAFEQAMNDARFFPRELDFTRTKSPSGRDEYRNAHLQSCWFGWQASAARRTPSASTGEDGLPELPEPKYAADDLTDIFTADQMRQYARDAVEADRCRPKGEMSPELKAAIEEAHKTRATGALLPDGSAVFINYGDQPEDTAHLCCTACGGSGHIDDQRLIAGQSGEESPQAAQGVKTWQERMGPGYIDGGADLPEEVAMKAEIADLRAQLARQSQSEPFDLTKLTRWTFDGGMTAAVAKDGQWVEYKDLAWRCAAPPLSSEQQAEKG